MGPMQSVPRINLMGNQDHLRNWIITNCPLIWSLLNGRAQKRLPKGWVEYIDRGGQSERESGQRNVKVIENKLLELRRVCGSYSIEDIYRRDFSGVDSENQLAELFCEIGLCASIANLSSKIQLRPPTGKGTHSDVLFNLHGFPIYGEVKRYVDPWPPIEKMNGPINLKVPYSRSISARPLEEKPHNSARPRSMDLRSKLRDVYRQFPEKALNILFVFHTSQVGESERYLRQTLFGDSNFFDHRTKAVLDSDGLFFNEEWRSISLVCLVRFDSEAGMIFPSIWKNPRAILEMPLPVLQVFR